MFVGTGPDVWAAGNASPHHPAGVLAMFVDSALRYYAYSGDAEVLTSVVLPFADHLLASGMTEPTDAWASVPYSCSDYLSLTYHGANLTTGSGDGCGYLEPDKRRLARHGRKRSPDSREATAQSIASQGLRRCSTAVLSSAARATGAAMTGNPLPTDGLARTLILHAKAPSLSIDGDLRERNIPRPEYLDLAIATGASIIDFHDVEASAHPIVRAFARTSPLCGLALLGFLRRHEFDWFYATGEDIAIPLGALFRTVGLKGRLTAVIHRCDTPTRSLALRAVGYEVFRHVICLASAQRRALTCELGFPAHKVHRFDPWIDPEFFRSEPAAAPSGAGEYVLACGRESRDYPTLAKAAVGLDLRFQVVASGWAPHAGFDPATGIETKENIVVRAGLSYRELRDAYARARFVVVPLDRVTYAAGVTSICEGMAMGKAIVVTASPGILDYVKPEISGLLVPVGDAGALREAIRSLWNDPARCRAMGEHNRRWTLEQFATEKYVARVAGLWGR